MFRKFPSAVLIACSLFMHVPLGSAEGVKAFTDVTAKTPGAEAINYLHEQGLLKGYADGSFKPKEIVDKAAALKMVLAGRIGDEQVKGLKNPGFTDITAGVWYEGYVSKAVQLGIVDGPSKNPAFNGSSPVVLAVFLKLLLKAQNMDPGGYGDIQMPLATDVTDSSAWFYPYFRVALATSVLQIDAEGMLHPDKKLTRADVATYVYRLLMYKQNRRTQALLSVCDTELAGNVIANLNANGLPLAKMAATRAMLAARGALSSRPDSGVVKGAVKVSEGFTALVQAYEAGVGGHPDDVLVLTAKAYDLAGKAEAFSPDLATIAQNMRDIAHNMAEEARAVQNQ